MSAGSITVVLQRLSQGDPLAAEQLLPLVYGELRQLAAARLTDASPGENPLPTALVHEAWLRLGGDPQLPWRDRTQFFAAAAEAMRRILVDQAHLSRTADIRLAIAHPNANPDEILDLHAALDALAAHDPALAELVKQRYFVGLTLEEAADVLGLPRSTAHRHWAYARGWLFNEVKRLRESRPVDAHPTPGK